MSSFGDTITSIPASSASFLKVEPKTPVESTRLLNTYAAVVEFNSKRVATTLRKIALLPYGTYSDEGEILLKTIGGDVTVLRDLFHKLYVTIYGHT